MNKTSRRYCFTSFDTSTPPQDLLDAIQATGLVKYAIFQTETCPTSQKNHLQGYLVFTSPVRGTRLQGLHPSLKTAHIETAKGSHDDCVSYCSKTETRLDGPYRFGDDAVCGKGKRTDVQALKRSIDAGNSISQIWDDHPDLTLRYFNSICKIRLIKEAPRTEQTQFHFVFGPSGFGKSFYVQENAKDGYFKDASRWWDGYDGRSDVVMDDFYGWIKYDELLRLGNAHAYRVESKGSTINFNSKNIYFTSNYGPDHIYRNVPFKEPFLRRLTTITLFTAFKEMRIWKSGPGDTVEHWAWTLYSRDELYVRDGPIIRETSQNTNVYDIN